MTDGEQFYARFPAIRVDQPLGEFYAVAIPADILLNVTYTDKLTAIKSGDSYSLQGSQRQLRDARLREIGRYISTSEAAFPNSIILAANYSDVDGLAVHDEALKWQIINRPNDEDCLELIIPTDRRLAPVIDGQHRLFGFTEAKRERLKMPVLCSVFLDLPRPYQAYLFATINSTQKPVDRSQTYELFGYNLDEEPANQWSPEKLAVFLSRKLNTEASSPLYQRILVAAENDFAITRAEARAQDRWMVSTSTVVDGITRLISSSPKQDADELRTGKDRTRSELVTLRPKDKSPLRSLYLETRDKVLLAAVNNFFQAVTDVCGPEIASTSYLTKTVGVQALFDTLRALAPSALAERDFSKDWFLAKLQPLRNIDFTSQEFQQASGQGRTLIKRVLFTLLELETNLEPEKQDEINDLIRSVTV